MSKKISSGCTSLHLFPLPVEENDIEAAYVTYRQNGVNVLEKSLEDDLYYRNSSTLACPFTQEDSLLFDKELGEVRLQVRVKMKIGVAIKSTVMVAKPDELLKSGVI